MIWLEKFDNWIAMNAERIQWLIIGFLFIVLIIFFRELLK